MNRYSKTDNWVLILLSVTFALTDWRIYNVAISDIILIIIWGIFIFKGNIKIKNKQVLLYIGILFFVFINIGFNLLFNTQFVLSDGIKGILKVIYYMATIMILYNNISDKNLQLRFLKVLSVTAVIICAIGIYIYIAIYLNGLLPYKFFWKLTRTDLESYTYRGWGRSIIRTRSIFGEPAHLGYYLNTIMGIFYFNKDKYKIDKKVDMIITITTLLTFSFSSIIVMILIKALHYMNLKVLNGLFTNKRYIFSTFIMVIAIIFMWETIEKTIIIRIQEILRGADGSATARLLGSWAHINKENILIGNGIGNSPILWNIYAYILSDLGLIIFLIFIMFTGSLFFINFNMGMLVVMQGFQKGGYLGAGYWIFMLLIMIYIGKKNYSDNLIELVEI